MFEQTIPIAKQVDIILRKKIYSGQYSDGQLPSESQLAAELGVSRATIRTILVKFESEGIITRKHGQGTFINSRVLDVNSRINGAWDFRPLIEQGGRIPTVNKISIERRFPTREESYALDIAENTEVICMLRLFLADEQPVIYSTNLIPSHFFNMDDIEIIDTHLPISKLMHTYFEQDISYCLSDISSEILPSFLQEYLQLETGSSLLCFHDCFYNLNDQPIMYGINYYNDKIMPLRIARTWA